MNKFTNDQHMKIVEFYYSSGKSIIQTQRKFRNHFIVREQPSENTIRNLIARFESKGSVHDSACSGRPKTSRTPENIDRDRESVNENPETSTRKRETQFRMARSSLRRITKKDLLLFPYKLQMVHEMSPQDPANRPTFATKLQQLVRDDLSRFGRARLCEEANGGHLQGITIHN